MWDWEETLCYENRGAGFGDFFGLEIKRDISLNCWMIFHLTKEEVQIEFLERLRNTASYDLTIVVVKKMH